MFIGDLNKALEAVRKQFPHIYLENVRGSADGGVVFKTTYFTYIKWFKDGHIEEHKEDEWRK